MGLVLNNTVFILKSAYYSNINGGTAQYVGPAISTLGLTAYYNAADPASYPGTGTNWYDLARSSTGSLLNSPTYNALSNISYFSFNGTNNKVEVPSNNDTNVTSSFTINTWIYPTTLPTVGTIQSIVCKYDNTPTTGFPSGGYDLRIQNSAGPILFNLGLNGSGSGQTNSVQASYAVSTNTWYCLTGVYDSGSAKLIIYVNGQYLISGSNTINPYPNPKLLNIGAFGFYSGTGADLGRYFAGGIANVEIYNRALSASEILNTFASQSASMFA